MTMNDAFLWSSGVLNCLGLKTQIKAVRTRPRPRQWLSRPRL